MFSDEFFASSPISSRRLEDFLLNRMAGEFFEDEVIDALTEAWRLDEYLMLGHRAWTRPWPHWFPYNSLVAHPRPPGRRPLLILPRLADDILPDSYKTKEIKEQSSSPDGKWTASYQDISSEASTSRKQTASDSDISTKGSKDSCSTDTDKILEESQWQFSVNMKGCDEVRAKTEGGMLAVDGRRSTNNSRQMVRYVTSLPRHISHDSLTASLSDGRLTVRQKGGTQLEGQARTLPIDVQRHDPHEPEEQQQHQQQQEEQQLETAEKAQ